MDIAAVRKEYDPAKGDLGRGKKSTRKEILEAVPQLREAGYRPFHTPGKDLRGWPDGPAFVGGAEVIPIYKPVEISPELDTPDGHIPAISGGLPTGGWVGWTKQEEDGKHYCVAFEF